MPVGSLLGHYFTYGLYTRSSIKLARQLNTPHWYPAVVPTHNNWQRKRKFQCCGSIEKLLPEIMYRNTCDNILNKRSHDKKVESFCMSLSSFNARRVAWVGGCRPVLNELRSLHSRNPTMIWLEVFDTLISHLPWRFLSCHMRSGGLQWFTGTTPRVTREHT